MPKVTRKSDKCTGHDACPPRPNNQASTDVFVNGKGAHRQGDSYSLHGCFIHKKHPAVLSGGSATVFVNGKPLGRIGDGVSCGGTAATGSDNVFAGG